MDSGPQWWVHPAQVLVCKPETTFRAAIAQLSQRRCHRLYVLDADGKLVGLFTLTDVLKEVAKACA